MNPDQPLRLFVAIYPSAAQRRAIEGVVRRLAPSYAPAAAGDAGAADGRRGPVRWVPPEAAHVTLAFLGDVEAGRLEEVHAAVREAASSHAPFDLSFRGVGAFPDPDRPRVVWLGVGDGRKAVIDLAATLRRALAPAGLADEDATFRPHLTLGRVRPGATEPERERLAGALESMPGVGTDAAPVREVVLVRSSTEPEGAVHEVVERVALAGSPAR